MSTPPFVALPRGVTRSEIAGVFGPLAAIEAEPLTEFRGAALLVPGFTGSKEDFLAALPWLQQLGWQVYAIDLRGQYQSGGPDEYDGYDIADFGADILAVAREIQSRHGQPLHVLGHSFGGLVVRQALIAHLAEHPEGDSLFASATLLASGPGALPDDIQPLAQQLISVLPDLPLQTIWDIKEQLEIETGSEPVYDAVYDFMRERFLANNPYGLRRKAEILCEMTDRVQELAVAAAAADLPLMVAYGDIDTRWTTAEQDDMARRLAARRFIFPETAHSPAAERPELFTAAMEGFWSDAVQLQALRINAPSEGFNAESGLPNAVVGYRSGVELRVPVIASPSAVSQTRRAISRQLQAWGLQSIIDDLQIVVSELVTNAVRYGGGTIELLLRVTPDSCRVEVSDSNNHDMPSARVSADDEPGGRGVPLIEALTDHWGVETNASGKIVWAEIDIPHVAA